MAGRRIGGYVLEAVADEAGYRVWRHRGPGGWTFEYREGRFREARVMDPQGRVVDSGLLRYADDAAEVFADHPGEW